MAVVTPLGYTPQMLWAAIRADQQLAERGIISPEVITRLRKEAAADAGALGFPFHAQNAEWPGILAASRVDYHLARCALPSMDQLDRSIELGIMACLQALTQAGWTAEICSKRDTALLVATSKGPVLRLLEACAVQHVGGQLSESLAWHVALGPAALQTALTKMINPGGPVQTHVAACAGSLVALHRAYQGISRGEFKRAIIVSADASIHPLFEHSFQNLGVFARPDESGHRHCRPFDIVGRGFFMSEAAVAVCLQGGDGGSVEVENCLLMADATHLLALDPVGTSLERGLRACAAGKEVAFVHAHAAGTQHDQVELSAIKRACGAEAAVFSHKRWIGHSLGASGLLGVVISTMCHQHGELPMGQKFSRPARSITIGQGFGGHIGMCVLAGSRGERRP